MQNSLLWDSRSLSASFSRVTGSRIKRSPALSETSNQSTFSTHDLERPLVVQILEILHDVQKKLNNFREETGYPLFTIRKELNVLFVRLFVCLFLFLFVLFSLRNMGIKLFLYADQPYINNFPSALLSSGFSIETADNFHWLSSGFLNQTTALKLQRHSRRLAKLACTRSSFILSSPAWEGTQQAETFLSCSQESSFFSGGR